MPQLGSLTRYEVKNDAGSATLHEEERTALEQRCRQLEVLVSELLWKNQTLRMQLAAGEMEER